MMKIHANLDRLERLINQPVSSRPDWLKHAREDAQEVLWLAHRAENDQDYDTLYELDMEASSIVERIEDRMNREF